MEPPPASLEAMVHSVRRSKPEPPGTPWLWWVALVLVVAVIASFVTR
jgi:hypothetical protein